MHSLLTPHHVFSFGAATTMIVGPNKNMLVNEATAILLDEDGQPLLFGDEAKRASDPTSTTTTFQIVEAGHIVDASNLSSLLRWYKRKITTSIAARVIPMPCVVVESLATSAVDRELYRSVFRSEGLFVQFVPALLAAHATVVGERAQGVQVIVDIGASHVQCAAVGPGGMIASRTLPYGGTYLDQLMHVMLLSELGIVTTLAECERAKVALSSGVPAVLRGKDRQSAQAASKAVSLVDVKTSWALYYQRLANGIKAFLADLPAAAMTSVPESGVMLIGGMAQLRGAEETLTQYVGVPVRVAARPTSAVALGAHTMIRKRRTYAAS